MQGTWAARSKTEHAVLSHSLQMQQAWAQSGPTIQRFGLVSRHLRGLVELAGWGKVTKAICLGAGHLPVERKHFFPQLTYHRDGRMCCRGLIHGSRRWERQHLFTSPLGRYNTLPHCPAGRSQLLWTGLSDPSLGMVRALLETQSHASSAGRAPGEVPGVRSWLAGLCWPQLRS